MENGFIDSYHAAKKAYSRCALITLGAGVLMQGLGLLASLLAARLNMSRPAYLLFTQLPLPLTLIPAYFLFRPRETDEAVRREAVRAGEFLALFLAALPIVYGGNIAGSLLASLLTMGRSVNRLTELTTQMTFPLALHVTLVGPLAEELFFRGVILPRVIPYGQKTALVFSALLFALYHVNVYQFFYAFGMGLLLGALYLKTGSLRAGFLLHAAVNMLGGVLPLLILELSPVALAVFGLAVLILSGFGVASLLRIRREMIFLPASQELPADIGRQAAVRNAGFIALAAFSVALSLLDLYT